MRRSYSVSNEEVDTVMSHCILWLPLSSNGDFTDRISGNSLTRYNTTSWSWTTKNDGMYLLTTSSSIKNKLGGINVDLSNVFENKEITVLAEMTKSTTSSATKYPLAVTINSPTPIYNITPRAGQYGAINDYPTNGVAKCATVYNNGTYSWYKDGTKIRDLSVLQNNTQNLSYTNQSNTNSPNILIGYSGTSGTSNTSIKFYIRNIMVFDKALTLDEIKEIQNI